MSLDERDTFERTIKDILISADILEPNSNLLTFKDVMSDDGGRQESYYEASYKGTAFVWLYNSYDSPYWISILEKSGDDHAHEFSSIEELRRNSEYANAIVSIIKHINKKTK